MQTMAERKPTNTSTREVDDRELVKRFNDGDESAFSAIVLRYQKRLTMVARGILGDENEALDAAQDTFVKAYFNIKTFKGSSSLYTWLYRILYNLCMSSLRRKKIVSFVSFDFHDETHPIASNGESPVDLLERDDIKAAIDEAITTLPLRQRTVFVMKQIEGLKHNEIAEIMGVSEGTVKASYFHAVQKLRTLLSRYGDAYGM